MDEGEREELAAQLGRHYVAGALEAAALDERLTAVYAAPDREAAALALRDLPAPEAVHVPERAQRGWWRRRHGEGATPQASWVPTKERFVDPTTQRVMRVWLDPATRARHYRPE